MGYSKIRIIGMQFTVNNGEKSSKSNNIRIKFYLWAFLFGIIAGKRADKEKLI